jgi:D-alanine-D-alanine ligase
MTPLLLNYPISVSILYYGGTAGDMVDTIEGVESIKEALESRGHVVRTLEVNRKNWRQAVKISGDVVFNMVEDETWDLYMKVGMRLEEMGRAQLGMDINSFKYVMKKSRIKRKMQRLGISTPGFKIYNRKSKFSDIRSLDYPLMVKPSGMHAGYGISQDSVVIDGAELYDRVQYLFKNFPGEVLAEEFIDGREIHVTVIGNNRHVVTLPYTEIEFQGSFADNWNVYTYDAKWEEKSWEYWDARIHSPALMSKKLAAKIEKLVLKTYRAFGCRDFARFDIRVDEKKETPYVVDINLCPSINQSDDQDATTLSVKALGWSYEEFVETLVAISYKRVYGKLPDRTRHRGLLLSAPVKQI